jgi:hypothetical protein
LVHATVSRARQKATVSPETVAKRTGKDGKQRKLPEPKKQNEERKPVAKTTVPAEPRKPPKPDANVVKQAGNFHVEVMNYTQEYCERIKVWCAANEIDDESWRWVVEALEMASMRLQRTAQDIDGR